jgi:hypothetical protein
MILLNTNLLTRMTRSHDPQSGVWTDYNLHVFRTYKIMPSQMPRSYRLRPGVAFRPS